MPLRRFFSTAQHQISTTTCTKTQTLHLFQLATTHIIPYHPPHNITAHLPKVKMAPPTATSGGVVLNQANVNLLVAVFKQNPTINYNQLASDLNVNVGTAAKQWSRFKLEKLKIPKNGDKQGQMNDGDEGEVTPKAKGGKKAVGGGSGKKRGRAADEGDDEESPSKKAVATKKGVRGKKGGQVIGEQSEGHDGNVGLFEGESMKEEAQHQDYDDELAVYEDAEE